MNMNLYQSRHSCIGTMIPVLTVLAISFLLVEMSAAFTPIMPSRKTTTTITSSSLLVRSTNDHEDFNNHDSPTTTRRTMLKDATTTTLASVTTTMMMMMMVLPPSMANAADNTSKPTEFTNMGTQAPAPVGETAFRTLSSGVQIKDYKIAPDGPQITPTSTKVSVQLSGRLLNLNGVVFYNTKNNNPDGFGAIPLTFDLGAGQVLPGLEQGLVGMTKGSIRRIIVPPSLAYSQYPNLEPQPTNVEDRRALDSVLKNPRRDATILFDVSVERFKN